MHCQRFFLQTVRKFARNCAKQIIYLTFCKMGRVMIMMSHENWENLINHSFVKNCFVFESITGKFFPSNFTVITQKMLNSLPICLMSSCAQIFSWHRSFVVVAIIWDLFSKSSSTFESNAGFSTLAIFWPYLRMLAKLSKISIQNVTFISYEQ